MRGSLMLIVAACVALVIAGCGGDDSTTETAASTEAASPSTAEGKPTVELPKQEPKGLVKEDLKVGDGAEAKNGDEVTVQYVGVGLDSEEEFDASWDRGEPFTFTLGSGMVIPGWEKGVEGMKEGGRRQLVIPGKLAYGPAGSPPSIGPDETLVFVVDLVEVD